MGDKWTTSGRSRLKAIQKKTFSHRAHQQRQNRSTNGSTANISMENNAMPPSFRTNDSLNTEDCHPRLRKRQASFAGTYSSHADPIARRGVWVSMGPAQGEYNPNHPPIAMQQMYNSRRIRDSSKFQSNANHANNERNKQRMMQNYGYGNVPMLHHANTTVSTHTQQYNHRPVPGPYLATLPRGEHEYADPLAYSAQAHMSTIAPIPPIPFDYEQSQYLPQDHASEQRETLLPINRITNFARRVSGQYIDDRQNPLVGLDDSYIYEQPQRRSGMMATTNNITPGNFSCGSFEDAWKTDRIQYQTKGRSRSFEEAFGLQTSNQNVAVSVSKGISRFQKLNKIPKFDSISVDAEIGTDDTDWGLDHQQDSSFYDDVLHPVYSTVSNDESIITRGASSCNLGEGSRHRNSATEWDTSQGFGFSTNPQDFRGDDRRQPNNHGIAFFQRRQTQSVPLHPFEEDGAVTNDGMVNATQYEQNDIAYEEDLLFGVHPSYEVDPVSYSSPPQHPTSTDSNFSEFGLPSRTGFDNFQPQASATISKSQFVSMHVSRQPRTTNAPSSIIKQSFYQNESFDDCKGSIAFDEHFLGGENGSTDFPHQDYSKANRYSIRYITEAIEVDIEKGSFFSPNSGTRCDDEHYDSTGVPVMQQGQTRHFTTKTQEQHEAVGHAGVNADLDDEIDLQGMQSLWGM